MDTWTTIETDCGYPTAICLAEGGPRVSTTYGDGADGASPASKRQHYSDACAAIDHHYSVWCDAESRRADQGEGDGEEVWYPRVLDQQPTHWLTVGDARFSVLPVGEGCEPCDLSEDCGLSTREEWLEGAGADYELRAGVLHCSGSLAVGEWRLDPITRE